MSALRTWLLGRLAGHIDLVRGRIEEVLELDDDALIAALGGREQDRVRERARDPGTRRGEAPVRRGRPRDHLRLRSGYPPRAPGAARRRRRCCTSPAAWSGCSGDRARTPWRSSARGAPSAYGLEVARSLGRGLGLAGRPGGERDGARDRLGGARRCARGGRTDGRRAPRFGPTVLIPPASGRSTAGSSRGGVAVSELGPGTSVRRWMFLARNRIIAALAAMTVVVEAGEHSGCAGHRPAGRASLGRPVGAVPGRVTTPQAAGPERAAGRRRAPGAGRPGRARPPVRRRRAPGRRAGAPRSRRPSSVHCWRRSPRATTRAAALARAGFGPDRGLAALARIELEGFVRRGPGGRFVVAP